MSLDPQADSIETQPAVAVVIPAFNAAAYIGQAVESVLAQTYPACRAIVVNDGSPDTEQLEAALAPYRSRITYIRQENAGPSGARNRGIREATEPLVAFLDADDYWAPHFVSTQVATLNSGPFDLVFADILHFSENGRWQQRFMKVMPPPSTVTYRSLLAGECSIGTSSVLVRRAVLAVLGGFDEGIGNYSEDFELYLRIARAGHAIGYSTEVLAFHRRHDLNLTRVPLALTAGVLKVLESQPRDSLSQDELSALDGSLRWLRHQLLVDQGKAACVSGDVGAARRDWQAAVEIMPNWKVGLALRMLGSAPGTLRRGLRWYLALRGTTP